STGRARDRPNLSILPASFYAGCKQDLGGKARVRRLIRKLGSNLSKFDASEILRTCRRFAPFRQKNSLPTSPECWPRFIPPQFTALTLTKLRSRSTPRVGVRSLWWLVCPTRRSRKARTGLRPRFQTAAISGRVGGPP